MAPRAAIELGAAAPDKAIKRPATEHVALSLNLFEAPTEDDVPAEGSLPQNIEPQPSVEEEKMEEGVESDPTMSEEAATPITPTAV